MGNMDKYQSASTLGALVAILGGLTLVVGWMTDYGWLLSEKSPSPDPADYLLQLRGPQVVMIAGTILVLLGIAYYVSARIASSRRAKRLFCPYCGNEVGSLGSKCSRCGGKLG